jgi:hypothetical protein
MAASAMRVSMARSNSRQERPSGVRLAIGAAGSRVR